MINLAIDIGNTRVKYAWFDQGELVEKSIEEGREF
jgi:pantothenate kinase type III